MSLNIRILDWHTVKDGSNKYIVYQLSCSKDGHEWNNSLKRWSEFHSFRDRLISLGLNPPPLKEGSPALPGKVKRRAKSGSKFLLACAEISEIAKHHEFTVFIGAPQLSQDQMINRINRSKSVKEEIDGTKSRKDRKERKEKERSRRLKDDKQAQTPVPISNRKAAKAQRKTPTTPKRKNRPKLDKLLRVHEELEAELQGTTRKHSKPPPVPNRSNREEMENLLGGREDEEVMSRARAYSEAPETQIKYDSYGDELEHEVIFEAAVLYDYTAETEKEIDLRKGQVIMVATDFESDDGWWSGSIIQDDGEIDFGYFPGSYVKVITN